MTDPDILNQMRKDIAEVKADVKEVKADVGLVNERIGHVETEVAVIKSKQETDSLVIRGTVSAVLLSVLYAGIKILIKQ